MLYEVITDRRDQGAALGELVEQRRLDGRGAGGDDDAFEGRVLGPAGPAVVVAGAHVQAKVAEAAAAWRSQSRPRCPWATACLRSKTRSTTACARA